jgi:hypothetical protein
MKEIILKFMDGKTEYIVYKEDDNYIPCKNIDDKISFDLSNDELNTIDTVFDKIKITDDRIKLSNIKFNNKEYQHFYDKTNNWNIFLNIDGSDITKEELRYFNNLFNYQDDIVYNSNENSNERNFIKRVVETTKKTFLVFVLSTTLVSSAAAMHYDIPAGMNSSENENVQEDNISNEEKIKNFEQAINNNPFLTNQEKQFLLSKFDVIYDNINLIDYQLVKNRFENLRIIYISEENENSSVAGSFTTVENVIRLYNCTCLDEIEEYKVVHEFFHTLDDINPSLTGLYEPINDIFANEYEGIKKEKYYRDYSKGYNNVKPYIYGLMEIIGAEPLRVFKFTGDISKIVYELKNIIDDENKIYELLIGINNINKYWSSIEFIANAQANENRVVDILNEYHEKKYNKSIYENADIMLCFKDLRYYFNECLYEFMDDNYGIKYDGRYGYDLKIQNQKIYFNNNCKSKNSEDYVFDIVEYEDFPQTGVIDDVCVVDYQIVIDDLFNRRLLDKTQYDKLNEIYKKYCNNEVDFDVLHSISREYGITIGVLGNRFSAGLKFNAIDYKKHNDVPISRNFMDGKDFKNVFDYWDSIMNYGAIKENEIDIDDTYSFKYTSDNTLIIYEKRTDNTKVPISTIEHNKITGVLSYINNELSKKKFNREYDDIDISLIDNILTVEGERFIYEIDIITGNQINDVWWKVPPYISAQKN